MQVYNTEHIASFFIFDPVTLVERMHLFISIIQSTEQK